MRPKTIKKMSAMELAHKCKVHVDTIYRNRRRGYCTWRMAGILESVTGIDRREWYTTDGDAWHKVLK
jgi:hypothetical protein